MATVATTQNPVILGVLSSGGNDYGFAYLHGTNPTAIEENDIICSISEFRQMVEDGEARPVGSTGHTDLAAGIGIYDESQKKVNKADYEVYQFANGQFGICEKSSPGRGCVFGGDSANEDDYNHNYIQSVYDAWDGVLAKDDNYGYRIEL